MRREIGVNSTPGCTFHPSLIAFISDALQGSWFGADKGQLHPFTQLHSLVGESGPGNPQALLGAEILGPRIFLHDQWQRH